LDDGRCRTVVIARADETAEDLVLRGNGAQLGERFGLSSSLGKRERTRKLNILRHCRCAERVERFVPHLREHRGQLARVGATTMARFKLVDWGEKVA